MCNSKRLYDHLNSIHSYFQSTSFNVKLDNANISFSIGYNKLLEKVYNSTTENKHAIGISRKWWGMYSMQLPPAFLLPYVSFFFSS